MIRILIFSIALTIAAAGFVASSLFLPKKADIQRSIIYLNIADEF